MLIQFSPIRSGSTLIYNYLHELEKNPKKEHHYKWHNNNKYIITIRHPYNSIISLILIYEKEINMKNISEHLDEYIHGGGEDISKYNFNKSNHCVLLYEEFLDNHDLILDKLQIFFNKTISSQTRNKLKTKLNINNVKKHINKYETFSQYNKKTHFHGKHISKYNGNTDYMTLLNKDELALLENNIILKKIIDKYYK